MSRLDHSDIRIGTLIQADAGASYLAQILPHGFESFEITFGGAIGPASATSGSMAPRSRTPRQPKTSPDSSTQLTFLAVRWCAALPGLWKTVRWIRASRDSPKCLDRWPAEPKIAEFESRSKIATWAALGSTPVGISPIRLGPGG